MPESQIFNFLIEMGTHYALSYCLREASLRLMMMIVKVEHLFFLPASMAITAQ